MTRFGAKIFDFLNFLEFIKFYYVGKFTIPFDPFIFKPGLKPERAVSVKERLRSQ